MERQTYSGATGHEPIQRQLHRRLVCRVECGCGFVKQQDFGPLEHRARNGDALLLATDGGIPLGMRQEPGKTRAHTHTGTHNGREPVRNHDLMSTIDQSCRNI